MNGFIGIKTNWYTNVKKHLHVSKQLDYIIYKIRLHHIQNIQTQNQYSARMKGVKSRVLSFLLNAAILETPSSHVPAYYTPVIDKCYVCYNL